MVLHPDMVFSLSFRGRFPDAVSHSRDIVGEKRHPQFKQQLVNLVPNFFPFPQNNDHPFYSIADTPWLLLLSAI